LHGSSRAHPRRAGIVVKVVPGKLACTADFCVVDLRDDQILFKVGQRPGALHQDHHLGPPRSSLRPQTHPVAERDVHREEARVGRWCSAFTVAMGSSGPPLMRVGLATRQESHSHILRQQIGQREVPQIFADQHAKPSQTGVERAYARPAAEVAVLLEHAVRRRISFSVDGPDRPSSQ